MRKYMTLLIIKGAPNDYDDTMNSQCNKGKANGTPLIF